MLRRWQKGARRSSEWAAPHSFFFAPDICQRSWVGPAGSCHPCFCAAVYTPKKWNVARHKCRWNSSSSSATNVSGLKTKMWHTMKQPGEPLGGRRELLPAHTSKNCWINSTFTTLFACKCPLGRNCCSRTPHFLEGPYFRLRKNPTNQHRLFSVQLFSESLRKRLAGENGSYF